MAEDKKFYVGQKAFIQKGSKVLILRDPDLGLDFPGGKIQEGETDFDEALRREVLEETGLQIEIGEPFHRWFWKFGPGHRNAGKEVYLIGFRCSYLSGDVNLSDEHSESKWAKKGDFVDWNDGSPYFEALKVYFRGG